MTINRAVEFFENIPQILNKIKVIQEVGLGYIKLGQSSTTLSGGESQRVKLATELSKRDTGKTLYILDEPTTGLHFEDIRVLMNVLNKLVDKGNTVIIIEHNLDVIKMADYIIDMEMCIRDRFLVILQLFFTAAVRLVNSQLHTFRYFVGVHDDHAVYITGSTSGSLCQ